MINSKLDESVFDALFGQAVIDNFNEQLDLLTHDVDLEPQLIFSSEHEKRMRLLFIKENRKDKLRKTVKWSKRVAAILILAISLLFGSLMFVPEVRAVVIGTVVEWFDQFARFTSTSTGSTNSSINPKYIPDGFTEEYRHNDDMGTTILFINIKGVEIFYEARSVDTQLSVDNEGHEYEIENFNGIEYHVLRVVETGKENKIIWESDGQIYLLSSKIPIEELFKMALSVG